MCGIVGISTRNSNTVNESTLIAMRDELYSRGPDACGIYLSRDNATGLGHRRLSIIDLSERGQQPMTNEDESIWLTYNGEIYNYKELRKELICKGHFFKSSSDSEVIIHAYEEFGVDCVNMLEGMFAFAIYNDKKKELFLCRDRFGIKPLYFSFADSNTFLFGSEIKSLKRHPRFDREINYGALGDYFKYRYIPAPQTIYKNTRKLPHSHYMLLNTLDHTYEIKQYYCLQEKILNSSQKYSISDIHELLIKAVEKRLISDVEVGSFLSGGIDSSFITAIASQLHPNIKSFSIGFESSEHSEIEYAKSAANHLRTEHITNIIGSPEEETINTTANCFDEPFADNSSIPTYELCKLTSKYVKVALSGDGGDEIFSGYKWYSQYSNKFHNRLGMLRSLFNAIYYRNTNIERNNISESYYNRVIVNGYDDRELKYLLSDETFRKYKDQQENIFLRYSDNSFKKQKYIQYLDLNLFLVDDILTKVDRTSMSNSLEVRIPYLDHKLAEAVLAIDNDKINNDKRILKKLAESRLPSNIINRDKKGFSAPIHDWSFKLTINNTISGGKSLKDGIFNKNFINNITAKENKNNNNSRLWMIYMFEKWYSSLDPN